LRILPSVAAIKLLAAHFDDLVPCVHVLAISCSTRSSLLPKFGCEDF
jgi:hypothetical protein